MGGKSLSGNGWKWSCVSPCVSTTVTSSRGGTIFFIFSHSFTYLKVVGIFAKPQQQQRQQQQLSLNFPLISHPYPRHRHHYQRAKGAEAKGNRQEKGGRTSVFFSITAKAGQGKEEYAILAGGGKFFLLQFPICCFPSFRDHRGGRGGVPFLDSC